MARLLLAPLGLLVAVLGFLLSNAGTARAQPTFVDVYQIWWTVDGQNVYYSEARTKADAQRVASSLAMFPSKPKTEVRGPFKRPGHGREPVFAIVLQREKTEGNLVTGSASVNGVPLGTFYENDSKKIPAGVYKAHIRTSSSKNHVQGPGGKLGTSGDFLVELDGVPGRTAIQLHAGNKAEHSEGCFLLGPATTMGGAHFAPPALAALRLAFFDGQDRPNQSPRKVVTVEVRDAAAAAGKSIEAYIYYVHAQKVPDKAFERAARAAAGTDDGKTTKLLLPVTTKADFLAAWEKILERARADNAAVASVRVFSHASKEEPEQDGLEFAGAGGTVGKADLEGLPKLPWSEGGGVRIVLHGCNTGLVGSRGWAPAGVLARAQGVAAAGQTGYSYFSTDANQYRRIGDADQTIYLWAYKRRLNGLLGDGSRMAEAVFNP